MGNFVEAIKKGWTVSDVANVLAHGRNDEGRGFLVTLMETKNHLSRQVYLPYSPETEMLLNQASSVMPS
jgi:hypothetical protein